LNLSECGKIKNIKNKIKTKMKKAIFVSLLALLSATGFCQNKKENKAAKTTEANNTAPAVATEPKADQSNSSNTSTMLATPITEEQKKKEKVINKEFKELKKRIESDTTLNEEQKKSEIKAASKMKSKKMKEVFTPEQLQELKQNHKKKSEE
jgi:hypothetical protein